MQDTNKAAFVSSHPLNILSGQQKGTASVKTNPYWKQLEKLK